MLFGLLMSFKIITSRKMDIAVRAKIISCIVIQADGFLMLPTFIVSVKCLASLKRFVTIETRELIGLAGCMTCSHNEGQGYGKF